MNDSRLDHVLCLAVADRDMGAVRRALDAGDDPNGIGIEGLRPLHICAGKFDLEMARLLIARGADPNGRTERSETPFHVVARSVGDARSVLRIDDVLLVAGTNLEAIDSRGWTPLMVAAERGNVIAATDLLNIRANVNSKDYEGRTALNLAMMGGHGHMVELLLGHGASIGVTDDSAIP